MRPIEQQTVLITGATDGIGDVVARALVERGARVIVHGRNAERVEEARGRIGGEGATETAVADLASFAQVRALAEDPGQRHDRIDALANNAGIGFRTAPTGGDRTEDGHEPTWQVNFLSAFLLTSLLRPSLAADGGGRVVLVSSGVQSSGEVDLDQPDDPRGADPYSQSKIALVMLVRELGDRWRGQGIDANACSPGWIATKMGGSGGGELAAGADTPLWLLTAARWRTGPLTSSWVGGAPSGATFLVELSQLELIADRHLDQRAVGTDHVDLPLVAAAPRRLGDTDAHPAVGTGFGFGGGGRRVVRVEGVDVQGAPRQHDDHSDDEEGKDHPDEHDQQTLLGGGEGGIRG